MIQIPAERPETRWEAFAQKKGIRKNKRKRKELVWDEASQSWKKPWGFRRANDPMDVPIYEHKEGDGVFVAVCFWECRPGVVCRV